MATKTKKPKAKARVKKRARAGYLPGMEPEEHKKVHQAALEYADVRDARMSLAKKEVDAQAKLAAEMGEAGITAYHFGDVTAEIVSKTMVRVKIGTNGDGDGDE